MNPQTPGPLRYSDAGVDIDAQDRALARIKTLVKSTATPGVLSELGSFGGMFALPAGAWREPVLVSSVDGVGTKMKVAAMMGRFDTVGRDLVNHCVMDIFVQGARPLFFLDYVAAQRLDPDVVVALVEGVARGCREHACALIGGETAEMPGVYETGEYDLAGTIVGVVERSALMDGRAIRPGDVLLGFSSAGLHTNGYSLARKVFFDRMGLSPRSPLPGGVGTIGDALLAEHRSSYSLLERPAAEGRLHGLAHITGGGIPDKLPRVLPPGCRARVERGSWPVPAVFEAIRAGGDVPQEDMDRTFNMGIGLIAVVSEAQAGTLEAELSARGERVWRIGSIVAGEPGVEWA